MKCSRSRIVLTAGFVGLCAAAACGTDLRATYFFQSSLSAQEAGVPPLVLTDPSGTSGFQDVMVFGQNRTVLHVRGVSSPEVGQGGLSFPAAGRLAASSYSVELVFAFLERENAWRRIVDVQDRTSDNGFYVDPANKLNIFPVTGSETGFLNAEFEHVVLTVNGDQVGAYLNGLQQFVVGTNIMQINNPSSVVHLFLDNTAAGGRFEWSSSLIALARFYDGALTPSQVASLAADPFAEGPPPACAADFNGDGVLDPDDLADYIGAFFAVPPAPRSDFNHDGLTDPDDLADYIAAFFGGC